jgi:hypothetical protein
MMSELVYRQECPIHHKSKPHFLWGIKGVPRCPEGMEQVLDPNKVLSGWTKHDQPCRNCGCDTPHTLKCCNVCDHTQVLTVADVLDVLDRVRIPPQSGAD